MTHPTRCLVFRPANAFVRVLGLVLVAAVSGLAAPSEAAQRSRDRPVIHFVASGGFVFSAARITVDVRLEQGARLNVTLTSPSGASETLPMDRDEERHSWTGQLDQAGTWRAEATVSGVGSPQSASAAVSLDEGAPTCSLTISAPEQATHYLTAEFAVNSCDASATTGEIATRYITVLQDGVQISTLDASNQCERRFILPGDGNYEATVTVADDRGVTATCSSADVGVDALRTRMWPSVDLGGGLYRAKRPDIASADPSSLLAGGAGALTIAHRPAEVRTRTLMLRVAGGLAHNRWGGSSFDVILTQQTEGGFFGAGAGFWAPGDPDIMDAGIFATAGFNLPIYYQAGRTQVFTELRLFARQVTEVQDNFSGVVGIRFNLRPTHKIRARPRRGASGSRPADRR